MKSIFHLLTFLVICQAQAQQQQIDQLLYQYQQQHGFEGVVLVAEKGKTVYEKGFGLANRVWNVPNLPDTKFYLASISKQFTAALILQLAEEGILDLQKPILTYLPNYRKDVGSQVKLHHLLTHTSGIPNYTSIPGVWEDSLMLPYTTKEMAHKFCSGDLEFSPGAMYRYNNSGYLILAAIIETVTGNSFGYELRKRILEPLDMHDSGVGLGKNIILQLASGYIKEDSRYYQANHAHMPNLVGAASMYSTVHDLVKWDQALYTNQLLSEESLQQMTTSYTFDKTWIVPYENGYGYGVGIANVAHDAAKDTVNMVYHSGHISGYSCYFARFTKEEKLVILLSNIDDISTISMNAIAVNIYHIISDKKKIPVYGE